MDVGDPAVAGDEQHVEGQEGVAHPERGDVLAAEQEQHAGVVGHGVAEHQTLMELVGGFGNLDSEAEAGAADGGDGDLGAAEDHRRRRVRQDRGRDQQKEEHHDAADHEGASDGGTGRMGSAMEQIVRRRNRRPDGHPRFGREAAGGAVAGLVLGAGEHQIIAALQPFLGLGVVGILLQDRRVDHGDDPFLVAGTAAAVQHQQSVAPGGEAGGGFGAGLVQRFLEFGVGAPLVLDPLDQTFLFSLHGLDHLVEPALFFDRGHAAAAGGAHFAAELRDQADQPGGQRNHDHHDQQGAHRLRPSGSCAGESTMVF